MRIFFFGKFKETIGGFEFVHGDFGFWILEVSICWIGSIFLIS
jgi:hypothetical protein